MLNITLNRTKCLSFSSNSGSLRNSCPWLIVITAAGKVEVCQVCPRFEAMLSASDLNIETRFIQIPVELAPSWGNVGRLDNTFDRTFAPSDILFQVCIVQSIVVFRIFFECCSKISSFIIKINLFKKQKEILLRAIMKLMK